MNKNFLDMPYYCIDGYRNDYTTCIDVPIAVSAGYYRHENYFYYLFCLAAAHNWGNISINDWQALKGGIVHKFGLELMSLRIDNYPDLIPVIHGKLNQSIPVLMPAIYKAMFYFYLSGNPDSAHFILVSGYDSKRQCICVRDINHLYEAGVEQLMLVKATGLFCLFMTEEMLLDIWVKSNKIFIQENYLQYKGFYCFDTLFHNMLYSLEKTGEAQINNYEDLIRDFLKSSAFQNSKFTAIIHQYNDIMDDITRDAYGFEIAYFKCLHIILGEIGKWLAGYEQDPRAKNLLAEFNEFSGRYLDFRKNLVSRLIADAKNKKYYDDHELKQITANIRSLDEELFHFVAGAMDSLQCLEPGMANIV
jgi:hypothetical protein